MPALSMARTEARKGIPGRGFISGPMTWVLLRPGVTGPAKENVVVAAAGLHELSIFFLISNRISIDAASGRGPHQKSGFQYPRYVLRRRS